ncbi:MAG: alpha/beta fold hydrolase, partial [Pseudomonadales bacterium]
VDWIIDIPVPEIPQSTESLFYPKGAIRELDDPLFDSEIAALGMYEPAAFSEKVPTMFYALEEDSYRTPVVFVHGMGGSAREFASIVNQLDRKRYKPWFFYYPSGRDLDQLAEIFYDIYLSGEVVSLDAMPLIIVAHSMGGLVVREALNKYRGSKRENRVELLITIASPLGGHPAAAKGAKHGPLVLPSWNDLNPASPFMNRLFHKPLPPHVKHQLLYAYGNPKKQKRGENSDGVVPLSSQLNPVAQRQATEQFGFNSSHAGVLKDDDAIRHVVKAISQVKSDFPESHIKILMNGGYDIDLDDSYSEKEKYYIRTMGKYLYSVVSGRLEYLGNPTLERFVKVSQGKAKAKTDVERAWSKFVKDYPRYSD